MPKSPLMPNAPNGSDDPDPDSGSFFPCLSGSSPPENPKGRSGIGVNRTHPREAEARWWVKLGVNAASGVPVSVCGVNRRILTLMVALVPIVVFGVLLAVVTVPFVSLGPGPTFDTLGEVDGKQVVAIKGTQTKPTTGHLNMTTVCQSDGLTLGEALTLWMSGNEQLVPRDLVYPPGKSRDDVDKANNADFKQSEDSAEYAALGYLKYPAAVTVQSVDRPRVRRRAS